MSDNVLPVSNTSIFDQLCKEYAATGNPYEKMVARPVLVSPWPQTLQGIRPVVQVVDEIQSFPQIPSWAKEPLAVREPGESLEELTIGMPDMVSVPEKKEQIVVKTLSDSVVYHGPFKPLYGGVSSDEALNGMRRLGQTLVLEKPLSVVLYSGTVDTTSFESVTDSDAYVTELSDRVMAENSDYELTSIHVQDDMVNHNYKIIVRGKKRPRD